MNNDGDGDTPDHDRRREQIRAQAYEALCGHDEAAFCSIREGFRAGKGLPQSLRARLEDIIDRSRRG